MTPATVESLAATLESIFTVLALCVGAVWTYILFFKRREPYPRARITHILRTVGGGNKFQLVRLIYRIENSSTVLLPLDKIEIKVQQLKPLRERWVAILRDGGELSRTEGELDWPVLFEDLRDCSDYELEPSESEELQFDLQVSADVELVQVYSYMPNSLKSYRGIGWNCTSIHDLKEGDSHGKIDEQGRRLEEKHF